MFYSGVVWIPYTFFFLYLFYEQYGPRRYPQYLIALCLFMCSLFRCVWFLGYDVYHITLAFVVINRIAILFQFSAISLLILMWSRVLQVSVKRPKIIRAMRQRSQDVVSPLAGSVTLSTDGALSSAASGDENALAKTLNTYYWVTIAVNVVVWLFILITIILSTKVYPVLYQENIFFIAFLCLAEAVVILSVGVRTGLRISRELNKANAGNSKAPSEDRGCLAVWCSCFHDFYLLFFNSAGPRTRLNVQAQAIKKLLLISVIMFVLFSLRSLSYILGIFIIK